MKAEIVAWKANHDLYGEIGFRLPHVHKEEAPFEGELLYMWGEGDMYSIFNSEHEHWDRLEEEIRDLLEKHGCWYELQTRSTALITTDDEALQADYLMLHRWHWIQHLAEQRLFDVNAEVFEHFARDPSRLRSLAWRQFEEFLDAVFRNQGFFSELGPGDVTP